jgi:hypothetical protein
MMPEGMPEGMPPAEQMPEMPEMGGETLILDPQQLSEAGLDSLQEGDKFTVMLHGTVVSTEGGVAITVDRLMDGSVGDASGMEEEEPMEEPEEEEFVKPKMKVESPSESGFKF